MQLFNEKSKNISLVLSIIFLTVGIFYFTNHISEIAVSPYGNISSDRMTGVEEFILEVNKPTEVFLLHNAKIGSGYVSFKLAAADGQMIEDYKLREDKLINKSYKLKEGSYLCTIKRDVSKNKENIRFYFDKNDIEQRYLKRDFNSSNKFK